MDYITPTWVGCHQNGYMVGRQGHSIKMLVLHWMDGSLVGTDSWFQNPNAKVAAHYGIAKTAVHQYVKDSDTAYGAGNWPINLECLNIENEGGGPNHLPIDEQTYYSLAKLIVQLCQKYSIPLDRNHIKKHSEVKIGPTSCPGILDIDRVVQMALTLTQNPVSPTPAPQPTPIFQVTVTASSGVNVRTTPYVPDAGQPGNLVTLSPGVHAYKFGTVLNCLDTVPGEVIAGNSIWLRLAAVPGVIWSGATNFTHKPEAVPVISTPPPPVPTITIQVDQPIPAAKQTQYNLLEADFKAKVLSLFNS